MTAVRVPVRGGGHVSAEVTPAGGAPTGACVVLAHGAGGNMTNPLLEGVASTLAVDGSWVVRFNFRYVDAGRRTPDPMTVLEGTFEDVAAWARREAGERPLVLGGKSMGGRTASRLVATGYPARGLLLLGYPLHPSGEPEKLRTDHFPSIRIPSLFVQGTRDTLCRLDLLRPAIATLEGPATLHVIEDGDHSFHVPKRTGRSDADVQREIADVAAAWIRDAVLATA